MELWGTLNPSMVRNFVVAAPATLKTVLDVVETTVTADFATPANMWKGFKVVFRVSSPTCAGRGLSKGADFGGTVGLRVGDRFLVGSGGGMSSPV